jgi:hypothetical protein
MDKQKAIQQLNICYTQWEEQLEEPDKMGRTYYTHTCIDYEDHSNPFHKCACGATMEIK